MTTYTLNQATGVITNNDDGSIVPQDDTTLAFQNYAAWLLAGNAPIIDNTMPGDPSVDTGYPDIGLTKLQFIDRFTDEEYGAILQMADTNIALRIYLNKLDMTTPDANGWSIYLSDARTIAGVEAICSVLEQAGIIGVGQGIVRAQQILAPIVPT